MHKFFLILISLFLLSCDTNYYEGPIDSPSSNLEFMISINRTDRTKSNYAIVFLTVTDKRKDQSVEIDTRIGDVMKWAVDWYDDSTIVAYSSDIGPKSWRYLNGKIEELIVTPEIEAFARQLKINKYK